MRENYTKPLLTIEMFSVTQTTARDCSDNISTGMLNHNDAANCGYDFNGTIVFLTPEPCELNGEALGFACYNNPSEGNYIFSS